MKGDKESENLKNSKKKDEKVKKEKKPKKEELVNIYIFNIIIL
jgi:hypothetical protein